MSLKPSLANQPLSYVLGAMWADTTRPRRDGLDVWTQLEMAIINHDWPLAVVLAAAIEIDRAKRDLAEGTKQYGDMATLAAVLAVLQNQADLCAARNVESDQHVPDPPAVPYVPPKRVEFTPAELEESLKPQTFKQPPRIPNPPKLR